MAFPILGAVFRFAAGMASAGGRAASRIGRAFRGGGGGSGGKTKLTPEGAALDAIEDAHKGKRASNPGRALKDAERGSALEKLWKIDTAWSLAERMTQLIGDNAPTFIHAINVSVIGGPAADLRRVWYLACAAAFGRYRNRVNGISEVNLEGVWDVTGKAARVSIAYTFAGFAGQVDLPNQIPQILGGAPRMLIVPPAVQVGEWLWSKVKPAPAGGPAAAVPVPGGPAPAGGTRGGLDLIMNGPDQVTIGEAWPQFLRRPALEDLILPAAFPAAALRDTGRYTPFNPVFEECDADTLYVRFSGPYKKVDIFGELPKQPGDIFGGEGTGTLFLPYGQVSPITGPFIENFGTRERLRIGNKTYISSPKLPDDGRVITTGEKRDPRVQPPRPWVDGKSRMSMIDLISSALHQPCYAPEGPPCEENVLAASGRSLYAPGSWTSLKGKTSGDGFFPAPFPDQHVPRMTE